jgi:hypothetical protein
MKGSGEASLARTGPPSLSQRTCRYVDAKTGCVGFVQQGLHPSIGPFNRDQRSGIKCDAGHSVEPEGMTGPAAVLVGRSTGVRGHVSEKGGEVLVVLAFSESSGDISGQRTGLAFAHGLTRRGEDFVGEANGDLRGHTRIIPVARPLGDAEPAP